MDIRLALRRLSAFVVGGNWSFIKNVRVEKDLTVLKSISAGEDVSVGGDLTIAANKKFKGPLDLNTPQIIKGSLFVVTVNIVDDAELAKTFFIAPAACKIVAVIEIHGTVCDAADVLNIEKLGVGDALGSGDLMCDTGFTLNSTVNTPAVISPVDGADSALAPADRMATKMTTGDGTDYAAGTVTLLMEWT